MQEDRVRLLSVLPNDRTRVKGQKLKHKRFPVKTRKHFFHCEGDQEMAQVAREAVDSPSMEIQKTHLQWSWVALAEQDDLQRSFPTSAWL